MIIECVAIMALMAIELMALYKSVNGKLLALVAAIIGGIAGYTIQLNFLP